jgi:FkbM family methyltransferase
MGHLDICSLPEVTCFGSQFGEDDIIAELFPPGYEGIYVDVGAAHPMECSNTWSLYKLGWRGLLIEPNPVFWWSLMMYRRGDAIFPCAASNVQGRLQLRENSYLSSFRDDWPIESEQSIACPTYPLRDILERYPYVRNCDVCSIDVEGHEREVLLGNDWQTFRPRVFVVEYRMYQADTFGRDISGEWAWILANHGYWQYKSTELNQIWLKGDK